jgi:hypothetical protein
VDALKPPALLPPATPKRAPVLPMLEAGHLVDAGGPQPVHHLQAAMSHNAAGPTGGAEKILHEFFPREASDDRFASEMAMMKRLGTTLEEQQALRDKMEEVEMYT